jgi:replicative superfamily II helicase
MPTKTNQFNYHELLRLYPDFKDSLRLYTLTELKSFKELNIKREADAFTANALQLRPYSGNGYTNTASLWVHPKDRAVYFSIENKILNEQDKIQRKHNKFSAICESLAEQHDLMDYKTHMERYALKHYSMFTEKQQSKLVTVFLNKQLASQKNKKRLQKKLVSYITKYLIENKDRVLEKEYDSWVAKIKTATSESEVASLSNPFFSAYQIQQKINKASRFVNNHYPNLKERDNIVKLIHNHSLYSFNEKQKNHIDKLVKKEYAIINQERLVSEMTKAIDELKIEHKHYFPTTYIERLGKNYRTNFDAIGRQIINQKLKAKIERDKYKKSLNDILTQLNISIPPTFLNFNNMNDTDFERLVASFNFFIDFGIDFNQLMISTKNPNQYFKELVREINHIQKSTRFNIHTGNEQHNSQKMFFNMTLSVVVQYDDLIMTLPCTEAKTTKIEDKLMILPKIAHFVKNSQSNDLETIVQSFHQGMSKLKTTLNVNLTKEHQLTRKLFPGKMLNKIGINYKKQSVTIPDILFEHIQLENKFLKSAEQAKDVLEQIPDLKNIYFRARTKKRKFIFYAGETNSGKTYHAFNKLITFNKGLYLAPLRLLALEGQEEIEKRGFSCSYITGEETDIKPDSQFQSSTIEMLNVNEEYDCAVIDEIQMIKDEGRGSHWLESMLGVNAHTIILTGTIAALPIVEKLVEYTEDELEVIQLEKKTTLSMTKSVNLDNIPDHSAIIAFSRKEIHRIRGLINKPVSIIYGALSPKVRRQEAEKFRTGETKLLISTDAIGMGLNLPIKNIYFSNISKFNGQGIVDLTTEEILQLSGRAGRYKLFDEGFVGFIDTYFPMVDGRYVNKLISTALTKKISEPIQRASLAISPNMFRLLSDLLSTQNIADIIDFYDRFMNKATKPDFITIKNSYDFKERSHFIMNYLKNRNHGLNFEDEIGLFFLPFEISKKSSVTEHILNVFIHNKQSKIQNQSVRLMDTKKINELNNSMLSIENLEKEIYICDLIHNIEQRYPDVMMCDHEYEHHKSLCERKMSKIINSHNLKNNCRECRQPIEISRHALCDSCFQNNKMYAY